MANFGRSILEGSGSCGNAGRGDSIEREGGEGEWVSNQGDIVVRVGGAGPRKQDGSIAAMPGQRSRKYFESFKFKGRGEGEGDDPG